MMRSTLLMCLVALPFAAEGAAVTPATDGPNELVSSLVHLLQSSKTLSPYASALGVFAAEEAVFYKTLVEHMDPETYQHAREAMHRHPHSAVAPTPAAAASATAATASAAAAGTVAAAATGPSSASGIWAGEDMHTRWAVDVASLTPPTGPGCSDQSHPSTLLDVLGDAATGAADTMTAISVGDTPVSDAEEQGLSPEAIEYRRSLLQAGGSTVPSQLQQQQAAHVAKDAADRAAADAAPVPDVWIPGIYRSKTDPLTGQKLISVGPLGSVFSKTSSATGTDSTEKVFGGLTTSVVKRGDTTATQVGPAGVVYKGSATNGVNTAQVGPVGVIYKGSTNTNTGSSVTHVGAGTINVVVPAPITPVSALVSKADRVAGGGTGLPVATAVATPATATLPSAATSALVTAALTSATATRTTAAAAAPTAAATATPAATLATAVSSGSGGFFKSLAAGFMGRRALLGSSNDNPFIEAVAYVADNATQVHTAPVNDVQHANVSQSDKDHMSQLAKALASSLGSMVVDVKSINLKN
ncbi:MAG: hypothetical protein WDW38_011236 [Sanguina aurantia]